MKKLLLILPFLLLAGCEYRYRYPCQDPANWGKPECSNEACKADGVCTSHTLGLPDNAKPDSNWNRPPPGTSRFGNDKDSDGIPDDQECPKPASKPATGDKPSWRKPPQPAKPANLESSKFESYENSVAMKSETPAIIPVKIKEPEQEKPLTMDTIVNTKAHNKAAS